MKKLAVISALLLTACASVPPADIDARVQQWYGKHVDELVQVWGLPTSQRTLDGQKYAEWSKVESKSQPSFSVGAGSAGGRVGAGVGVTLFGGEKEDFCTAQVRYQEGGIIDRITWNGNPDVCDEVLLTPGDSDFD